MSITAQRPLARAKPVAFERHTRRPASKKPTRRTRSFGECNRQKRRDVSAEPRHPHPSYKSRRPEAPQPAEWAECVSSGRKPQGETIPTATFSLSVNRTSNALQTGGTVVANLPHARLHSGPPHDARQTRPVPIPRPKITTTRAPRSGRRRTQRTKPSGRIPPIGSQPTPNFTDAPTRP